MKAAFPGSLLVAPVSLALSQRQLPVDVRVTPLAGTQDLPGSWPLQALDMVVVSWGRSFCGAVMVLFVVRMWVRCTRPASGGGGAVNTAQLIALVQLHDAGARRGGCRLV
jgi:hypothetical protein